MPRTSAEERSANFYRKAHQRLAPPKMLPARARAIWRSIVQAKPIDWFDASQLGLLAGHCRTEVRLEEVWAALEQVPVGSAESTRLTAELKTLTGNYATSARLLRLTVQAAIERHEAKAGERRPHAAGDALIGGAALRGPKIRIVE